MAAGLRTAVDAMPADCGRNAVKLAELSRSTGINLVAPTGLHHERFYGPAHWSTRLDTDALAELFAADIDRRDRRQRLCRAGRRADRRAGRRHQDRRQRGRSVGPRPPRVRGRGRDAPRGPVCRS